MKKQITRSLCCLLALLLCLGSTIYTPAAQDDQTQVSFTVTLATGKTTDYATLKVLDKDGKAMPCQEDEYGYDTYDYLLPAGDYTYTATYQSGSQTASGSFTVTAGESRRIPVQLTYTQYKVRFNTTPQNATVALYKNGASGAYGDPILPDEQGFYTIIFGQYRYIVSAEGYTTAVSEESRDGRRIITYTNRREIAVPTGVRGQAAPGALAVVLGGAVLGAVGLVRRRHL